LVVGEVRGDEDVREHVPNWCVGMAGDAMPLGLGGWFRWGGDRAGMACYGGSGDRNVPLLWCVVRRTLACGDEGLAGALRARGEL
jgi:hypothetical protein